MARDRNEHVLAEVAKQKADEVREVTLDDVNDDDDDDISPTSNEEYDSFASDDEYFDDDVTPPVPPRLPVVTKQTPRAVPLPALAGACVQFTADERFQPAERTLPSHSRGFV